MTIIYSLISRGPTILCSHQVGAGNFEDVAHSMLHNIPTRNNTKITYTSNNYLFHVVVDNGLIFLCAADPEFGRTQPYGYLNEIIKLFNNCSLANRAQFATEGELDRDFQQVMVRQMERYSNPAETDNIGKLQSQVEEVKGVMTQNIEKVLERGEKLDDLIEQTNQLEAHSHSFQKAARKVRRKMFCNNMKMTIYMVIGGIVVLTVLVLIILFATGVLPPSSNGGSATTIKPTL